MDSSSSKRKSSEVRRANVIYFLSRDGRIEHPHLIRVQHFCHSGVHLRDVKRWLSKLRGKQMPESFSWSYQRRYKNGFVWQDLTDDDLITPISDYEYVLLGSLLPAAAAAAAAAAADADPPSASAVTKQSKFNDLFYPGNSTPESEKDKVDNVTISKEDKPPPKEKVEEADRGSTYSKSLQLLPSPVACRAVVGMDDSAVLDAAGRASDIAVGDGGGGVGASNGGSGLHCGMKTNIVGSTWSPPSFRQSSGSHSRADSWGSCFSWFWL